MRLSAIKVATVLMVLALVLSFPGAITLAAVGDVTVGSPSPNPHVKAKFTVPVTVDSGTSALGAYDFTITSDPSIVRLQSIQGGSAPELSAAPVSNPTTFPSGATDFNAVNTSSLTSPTGVAEVANLQFEALKTGESQLCIIVNELIDTDGFDISPANPICGSVTVEGIAATGSNNLWMFILGLFSLLGGLFVLTRGRKGSPFITPLIIFILVAVAFLTQLGAASAAVFGDADSNGTFDGDDYGYIQRYLSRHEVIPPPIENIDPNGDHDTTIKQALLLAQVQHGLRSPLSNIINKSLVDISPPAGGGQAQLLGAPGSAPPITTVKIWNRNSGDVVTTPVAPDGSFNASIQANVNDTIVAYVLDGGSNPGVPQTFAIPTPERVSPPPETILTRDPSAPPQETPRPCCCIDEKEPSQAPCEEEGNDGRSVYRHSGETFELATDLAIPGRGFDFAFTRKYKNQITYQGPLGYNWDFNYNKRLGRSGPDVVYFDGYARQDVYTSDGLGGFISPPGFFNKLFENLSGSFTLREPDGTRYLFRAFDSSGAQGKLAAIVDRNHNMMRFSYDAEGKLIEILDTLGRDILLEYDGNGRIIRLTDFAGREVTYAYDPNGDLETVTSPAVTGTPNGNDFPDGKTTKYGYTSGEGDPLLNHNLTTVTRPNEVAEEPDGPPFVQNAYGPDDRLVSQTWGGTNDSGVPAGGILTFIYNPLPGDPFDVTSETGLTTAIDRAGNLTEYFYNAVGDLLRTVEYTNRGVRSGEAPSYETRYTYNDDHLMISMVLPDENQAQYQYDSASPSRFSQRNLLEETRSAGPVRGPVSDQPSLTTTYTYEPMFNMVRTKTDPRGNDGSYVPPLGSQSASRYTTINTYDYQEGNNLIPIADELRTTTIEANGLLAATGVSLNLGDVNGDGQTGQRSGNLIRTTEPTVLLPPGSSLITVEGDDTQEIVTDYHYNRFGQPTAEIDPEGNDTDHSYFDAPDPDGDGHIVWEHHAWRWQGAVSPRFRFSDGGGYLRETTQDSDTHPRRREAAPPAKVSNTFTYDEVGNRTTDTDGNGNTTLFILNQLNQVVRRVAASPFSYRTDVFYDHNDNQIRVDVQNATTNKFGFTETVIANPELTTTYVYDILDKRVLETREVSAGEVGPPELITTGFRYDANENRRLIVQPEGNETRFVYDERDLLYSITGGTCSAGHPTCVPLPIPDRPETTVDYDGSENRVAQTDAEDHNGDGLPETTEYVYDGFDRLVRTIDPAGGIIEYTYDPVDNIVQTRSQGQPSGPTPNDNSGAGNLLLSESQYLYDELDRRFQTHELLFNTPGGPLSPDSPLVTEYEYDRSGRRVRLIDPDGQATTYAYDGMHRLTRTTDALANEIGFSYDQNSNRISDVETDKSPSLPDESLTTRYEYDSLDRLILITDNVGETRRFHYDSRANTVRVTDANGPPIPDPTGEFPFATTPGGITTINDHGTPTRFTYDNLDRLVQTEQTAELSGPPPLFNPDGLVTTGQGWDKNSRLAERQDDNANTTSYEYDALNRLIRETFADGTSNAFTYDRDSNSETAADANGSVSDYSYDALDRLVRIDVTRAPGVEGTTQQDFEYDGLDRLTFSGDNNNPSTPLDDALSSHTYDSVDRLLSESQGGRVVTSAYDVDNNRVDLIYPGGQLLHFEYDALDRLTVLNDGPTPAGPDVAEYSYIGPGREAERDYLNGTRRTYLNDAGDTDIGYDGVRRVVEQRDLDAANALLSGFEYGYDREDNKRYEKFQHESGRGDAYQYDDAYRLTGVDYDVAAPEAGPGVLDTVYEYDGVGNRRLVLDGGGPTSYTVNGVNAYSDVGGVSRTHDSNGNLVNDGTQTYTYDFLNRLVRVVGAQTTVYAYDALNRRTSRMTGATTTAFVWDGWRLLEERDASDAVLAEYTYGNGIDEPLTMSRGGTTYYYHQNELGNVTTVTDDAGVVVERYKYDAYGEATFLEPDNTTVRPGSAIGNPYLFTGREYDSETNLYYLRNRYYHAETGRFLTRDPLGITGDVNFYTYTGEDPINWIDPWGDQYRRGDKKPRRKPNKINCLGYASREGCYVGVGLSGLSLKELVEDKLGWKCTKKKSADCECKCEEIMMMVYLYKWDESKRTKGKSAWEDAGIWGHGSADYHAIKCNDEWKGKGKYKCKSWSYIPHSMPKKDRSGGDHRCSPSHWCGGLGPKNPGKVGDADGFWPAGHKAKGNGYCCCKKNPSPSSNAKSCNPPQQPCDPEGGGTRPGGQPTPPVPPPGGGGPTTRPGGSGKPTLTGPVKGFEVEGGPGGGGWHPPEAGGYIPYE